MDTDHASPPEAAPPGRGLLGVLYLAVFVDLLGFGIILPLLPFYAERLGASGLELGILFTAYSGAQLFGASFLGRLSDRHGRRPVMLFALAGSSLSLLATGFAGSLWMLAGARALAGLFGGSISIAQAYIADVTRPEERARYMGFLGAAIGAGFVCGPALGALLTPWGFAAAAIVASALAAVNLVWACFVLPESSPVDRAARATRPRVGRVVRALTDRNLGPLLAATFLLTFGFVAMETTFAYLGQLRFGLDDRGFGLVLVLVGVVLIVVQGGLVGVASRRFGERPVAVAGAALMVAAFLFVPLAPALGWATAALALLAVGRGLSQPTLATLLSRSSAVDEQGAVLGLGQSVNAAGRAVGPLLAGFLYDLGVGLPYWLAALCAGGAVLAVGSVSAPQATDDPARAPSPEEASPGELSAGG